MKKNIKNLILRLPGPNSYCSCDEPCSNIEIEHVVPNKELKKRLSKPLYMEAYFDPNNLYRCCADLNKEKGASIVGRTYDAGEFSGMLARSCLYMNEIYNLKFDSNLVRTWNNLSLFYPPFDFEFERAKIIYLQTGSYNTYVHKNINVNRIQ